MLIDTITFNKDFRCFKAGETINFDQQITVITGDNGSGKSTLISCIRANFKSAWSISDDANCKGAISTNVENSEDTEIAYLCLSGDLLKSSGVMGDDIGLHIRTMHMSSGQGSVEQIVDKVESSKDKPLLILDEPERGLSMKRVSLISKYLKKHAAENPDQQIIVVTHSNFMMNLSEKVFSTSHKNYLTRDDYFHWLMTHRSMSSFASD